YDFPSSPRSKFMNTRSISAVSSFWCATAIALALPSSTFLAPLAASEPAAAQALPLPADAIAVIHIRVADIWKSEALSELRQLLVKAGPQALKAFDQRFVPAPSSLDRLTVVLRPPGETDREPIVAFYLTPSTPFDTLKFVQGSFREGEAVQVGNLTY